MLVLCHFLMAQLWIFQKLKSIFWIFKKKLTSTAISLYVCIDQHINHLREGPTKQTKKNNRQSCVYFIKTSRMKANVTPGPWQCATWSPWLRGMNKVSQLPAKMEQKCSFWTSQGWAWIESKVLTSDNPHTAGKSVVSGLKFEWCN